MHPLVFPLQKPYDTEDGGDKTDNTDHPGCEGEHCNKARVRNTEKGGEDLGVGEIAHV